MDYYRATLEFLRGCSEGKYTSQPKLVTSACRNLFRDETYNAVLSLFSKPNCGSCFKKLETELGLESDHEGTFAKLRAFMDPNVTRMLKTRFGTSVSGYVIDIYDTPEAYTALINDFDAKFYYYQGLTIDRRGDGSVRVYFY